MHLEGMGGTGKTQVIKALSAFFEARNESHRFIIVAPTGIAAALLVGLTYHSMFGINEHMSSNKIGNIKAKLNSIEYVFFNEVSMLSARDLHQINAQLAKVFNIAKIPFGGLNMVFSGDFGQLPPAIKGEHVSLYLRTIGTVSTNKKSQEEAIGKALWHQIMTVVILHQNMRQSKQSTEDTMMRTALKNLRYKACTPVDINFWRTKISSSLPDRSSICNKGFRDVSIITGTNLQKDEINRLGAICFARETGQDLVDFYSEDTSNVSPSDLDKASGTK
jgi:PIF1-like helicase